MDKKGLALENLYPIVVTLLMIGILLGIGIYTLDSVHRQVAVDYTSSQNNITNFTKTTTLANATLTNFYLETSSLVVKNQTATYTNYTATSSGVITWGNNIVLQNNRSYLNISFNMNYDKTNSPEERMTTSMTGIGGMATWIAVIVVVLAAAVVLGIVISSFGKQSSA
jgi:hypothetical protein